MHYKLARKKWLETVLKHDRNVRAMDHCLLRLVLVSGGFVMDNRAHSTENGDAKREERGFVRPS